MIAKTILLTPCGRQYNFSLQRARSQNAIIAAIIYFYKTYMKIEVREREGIAIISINGKITIGVGDVALRAQITDTLDSGAKNILINMSGVTTMDSSGIGELIHSYTTVTNHGGKLKLCNLPRKVIDILALTQLITVFDTFDDEEEAIASF